MKRLMLHAFAVAVLLLPASIFFTLSWFAMQSENPGPTWLLMLIGAAVGSFTMQGFMMVYGGTRKRGNG